MNKLLLISVCISLTQFGFSQTKIEVAEQTIKVGSKNEESLYYGFAEGDQIIFNFEEVDEKEVKEVEIIELPANSRYSGYEVKEVKDKILKVNKKAIYKFRIYNSAALKGRVCRIHIERIPKSTETENFNTGVKWVEKFDTTYDVRTEEVIVRYDTITKQKSRRVLASIDTNVAQVIDRVERVHSTTNGKGNVSLVTFQLPEDTYSPSIFLPYKATETTSWAYSISVGETGSAWYQDANRKAAAKVTSRLAVKAGLVTASGGALALLAIEGFSAFSNPPEGDNVQFRLYEGQSPTNLFGNSVAASGRVTTSNQGTFTFRLKNDNLVDGINVDVKVVAVTVTKTWKDEEYAVQEVEPVKEKKTLKIPKVSKTQVPQLVED